MSKDNFNIYRCPDPIKNKTSFPWYRIEDTCPCDPSLNNISGRGFTPCTFGLEIESSQNSVKQNSYQLKNQGYLKPLKGSLYENQQYSAPQLQPRPISRIGNQWRSAN